MSTVFTGTIKSTLKRTLDAIVTDSTEGFESKSLMRQFCNEETMDDNFVDDLEVAPPGLASEKTEGSALSVGTMREGTLWRYIARTFGQQLSVTREAVEDNKYPQAFKYVRYLLKAMWKTVDTDATLMLVRMFNSSYVGNDGVSLCSSSHPLPNGGTFSNQLATPMTPSRAALIVATAQLMAFPGHDGLPEGVMPKKIVCPVQQWGVWKGIVKSEYAPEAGNFNEVNVINQSWGGTIEEVIPNKFWTNTTTNWAIITDAEDGLKFKWKRKPEGDDWMDNSQQVFNYAVSARWARGWSDPRGILGSNS